MKYEEIRKDLLSIKNIKTKDVDSYNKKLIKNKEDVSDLETHVLEDQLVHRTYFQVSLKNLNDLDLQLKFIEDHALLLQDWWHVDQLVQFIKKPAKFEIVYPLAKRYIKSTHPFLRRWGYVIFLTGSMKEKEHTKKILSLIKDDEEYYVQMAEAWLICDLAVYNFEEVYNFLSQTNVKYNITGRAIQKMCDSFRISNERKQLVKLLREKLRNN